MADTTDGNFPKGHERLPIKVILPKQGRERKVGGGGGRPKSFRNVTPEYRASLRAQVDAIRSAVTPEIAKRVGSLPMRVKVITKAVAKSHRPENLFSEKTCPIIGGGGLGELFLKGSPEGLERLSDMVETNESEQIIKELSEVEVIEPVTPSFRRCKKQSLDILKNSPRGSKGFLTRVKLFDYGDSPDQQRLFDDFMRATKAAEVEVRRSGYSPGSLTFEVECRSDKQVDTLSNVIGVRSIGPMPVLRTVQPQAVNISPINGQLPKATDVDGDYPFVAVVDTGIAEDNPDLSTWITGRKSFVPEAYRNTTHGTFVAGLICWGRQLNSKLPGISDGPCGILDIQVIPNADPAFGDTDTITESEFLESLDEALKQYANRVKVWNLSLGTDEVCLLDEFSSFAQQLDDFQEKYQVSFVLSAGNYNTPPLLDYPRTGDQLAKGRITSPADSVLGVTVGAVSHTDYKSKGPKENQPSPFSRHGAGPNHIIKPDLVHFGGSCTTDASQVSGIRSIHGSGCGEDLGTSFSTPLVSRALAETYHSITPTPSPVLARALLTHHARDPRNGGRIPDGEENFFGFGRPMPPPYCLQCTPHSSTLVFEDTLRPGYFLEWDDFPYPASLTRDGRYYGEVWMTIAFAPARGSKWGTEYCETHIEANFGVYYNQTSRKTGKVSTKFRGLVPPEHKNPGLLYESYQIERLRKWAPVRTYHGNLNPSGERGNRWRLKLRLLTRHGIDQDRELVKPQPFSLVMTIADPEKKAPVYDEMAQVIRSRFRFDNLGVRVAAQIRTRA